MRIGFIQADGKLPHLTLMGIRPYIMKFNMRKDDLKLNHFTRWVNGFIYKKVPFEVYTPFAKLINRGILC